MANRIRSFLTSKQVVIAAGAAVLVSLGAVGVLLEEWWLAGLAILILLGLLTLVGADIHRKVGRGMALARFASSAQLEALADLGSEFESEVGARLEAIDRSRERTVSELATLRSQLLTRFDVLSKELSRYSKRLVDAAESVGSTATNLSNVVDNEAVRLSRVLDRAANGMEAMLDEVDQSVRKRMSDAFNDERAAIERLHQELIVEMDAMLQVHDRLRIDAPTPLMGGWAMSPVGMKTLIDMCTQEGVTTILECGSGTSTILMALAVKRSGRSEIRIVSLDHLQEFADSTRSQLDRVGLGDQVEVRLAPLEPTFVDEVEYPWYARSGYEDLTDINLVIVDGPPRATGPMARFPAYPILRELLSSPAYLILDDTRRGEERKIATEWLEDDRLRRREEQLTGQFVLEYRSE